ncbi:MULTISPECIES: cell wall metabolism sensor histidine kinase WalK [unclassified Cyanobium]|uniref:sensor histidine kinase n=1 Tax=unclassified Cyanobium TaxID=2627006 RepID=UPI0020CD4A54|nr:MULTISPECIES: HAMP domain-containing sensor histidine kinase [unclassified Cyanobium]MCP9777021.1 HAMP domain-containing histidine kinase [Cyanobium sp. Tous-M-B4]MCP9878162.1 HAMP domain-containing histidine kinase [Cyanobium sp. A2C-AMD]
MRISPLRLWLQSTSLLAVLAGYSLLLLFNQGLAGLQRGTAHQQLVQQLETTLAARARSRGQLQALTDSSLLPGLELRLRPAAAPAPAGAQPTEQGRQGQELLVSTTAISLLDGSTASLEVLQNVSASVRQERLAFWLLAVAAGLSSLFTSALLRLVLQRGLVQPLQEFTTQLSATQAPPLASDQIPVAEQPEELQPIALAFNDLQQRLSVSWERQRSFVDGVAHELRTPITLISGHAQRLLRQPGLEATAPSLRLIQQEAQRMGSLVSDLLDLARQDSGRLQLRRRPILADEALVQAYERLASSSGWRLHLDTPAAELPVAMGDPERLQQCLAALIENALHYSPTPLPVTLAADQQGDSLVLHVRDQGPGVDPSERDAIFGRFARGSAAINANSRGSGIGLAVVRLLMEAMGGSVVVAEAPGGGADFQLHLPLVRSLGVVSP